MENGLVYGLPMQQPLVYYDLNSQSWKTWERSLFVDYQTYSDRWPKSGLMRNGNVFQQVPLELPIGGNACGSWLTPTANDAKNNTFPKSQLEWGSVVGAVMRRWPTPRACDERHGKNTNPNDKRSGLPAAVLFPTMTAQGNLRGGSSAKKVVKKMINAGNINECEINALFGCSVQSLKEKWELVDSNVGLFPTPVASGKLCGGTRDFEKLHVLHAAGVISEEERRSMSNGGCLNPDWVEWLMGYPIGWTDTDTEPAAVIGWGADPADSGDISRVRERRKNDRKRLHALGNAIVPQVAELIWEMIKNTGRVEDEQK